LRAPSLAIPFDDAFLVQQVQQGEMAAYGQLVAKYQDRVYNACLRICGDPECARDLTQETFLKAMEAIGRFEGKSGFYTWVFRIAVNLCLSQRRKAGQATTVSIHQDSGDWDLNGQAAGLRVRRDTSGDPSRPIFQRECQEAVRAAIDSLEPEHRAVVVLKDVESLDYSRIAEILNVPTGTVKSRLHRARMELREKLRSYMADS
jgi:RNA polymerase sigma-70 factor, ECF subfamily